MSDTIETILITDYHCASNRGDAAILEGELAAIRKQFPDVEISVMTEYPSAARMLHGVKAVEQRLPPFKLSNMSKNIATLYTLADASFYDKNIRLPFIDHIIDNLNLQPYYDADLVISTGGQYITDIYFPSKIAILAELVLCKRLGKPVVLYAQTLGPFDSSRYKYLIQRVLNSVDLITTRDKQSVTYLEQLGVSEPPIYSQADAAWSMPSVSDQKPLQEYIGAEVPSPTNLHGPIVSISTRHWSYFDEGSEATYFNSIATVADRLIDEYKAKIIFASTCTGLAGYHTDDRIPAHKVINLMHSRNRDQVEILSGEYTPYQLVDFYGKMDFHIGTRMHSNILAMHAGTPVLPLEYQFKTTGMMHQFGLADLVLNIDGLDSDELWEVTEQILNDRDELAEQIENRLPHVRKDAHRNAILVRKYLEGNLS